MNYHGNKVTINSYNHTIIALSPTSMFLSLSLLHHTGLIGTWLTLTVHKLMLNFPVFQSIHLLKRRTSTVTFCALYQISMHHLLFGKFYLTTPLWIESIRDELHIAKSERRQEEWKWRNTKITIFKELYRQAKNKVSMLEHTVKCKSYTE